MLSSGKSAGCSRHTRTCVRQSVHLRAHQKGKARLSGHCSLKLLLFFHQILSLPEKLILDCVPHPLSTRYVLNVCFLFKVFPFFHYVFACLHVCVITCVQYLAGSEEGIRTSKTSIIDRWERPCWHVVNSKLNPEEKPGLKQSYSSLYFTFKFFNRKFYFNTFFQITIHWKNNTAVKFWIVSPFNKLFPFQTNSCLQTEEFQMYGLGPTRCASFDGKSLQTNLSVLKCRKKPLLSEW